MKGALRTYGDPCGIARALDRVGERWALLVVRDLLLGPKRFSDLRGGLVGASPNVLSQRLRELEQAGVVARRQLPPPAAATVYELTPWGRELEPVILALGRWGGQAAPVPRGELSADALMIALETTFDAEAAGTAPMRVELRLGDQRFCAVASRRRLQVTRGACEGAAAVIRTDAGCLRQVAFGRRTLREARERKELRVEGDEGLAARFLASFRPPPLRPAP